MKLWYCFVVRVNLRWSYFIYFYSYLLPKATHRQYWSGSGSHTKQADRQSSSQQGSLTLVDQLFATLMRLRLGLLVQDIADRFNISSATVSKYFTTWVSLLHLELKILNPFPSRSAVDRTMPDIFKPKYESVRVILDCTEIYVQRSSSILNQALTFSNYKHHNTLKFLVGITPSGVISFVSEAWGGRASDSHITINSGLLDLLDENDTVMADKGFLIEDALGKKKCKLVIPPFRGATPQFTTDQVFDTQEIARRHIHVERSIGRVKTFHILDGVLPLTLAPLATQIVCSLLTNFDVPLVKW